MPWRSACPPPALICSIRRRGVTNATPLEVVRRHSRRKCLVGAGTEGAEPSGKLWLAVGYHFGWNVTQKSVFDLSDGPPSLLTGG